jgi:hypothetical protein
MLELTADFIKEEEKVIHGQTVKVKVYSKPRLKITDAVYKMWNLTGFDSKDQYNNFKEKTGKLYLYKKD